MARPIASDYDQKRKAILKPAAVLFAQQGYDRASMAQVATACGISKANIYHYFAGKEDLLFAILENHLCSLRNRICGLTYASSDPAEQLHAIVTELLLAYQGADAEHAVQLNALKILPPAHQEILKDYQRDMVRLVQSRLRRIAPPSVARSKPKLRRLTMSIFAMVNWHYQWDNRASDQQRKSYATMITNLVLGGVEDI